MLLPCLRRQHQWISTLRLLLPCSRHQHQWKSTSRLLLPCPRRQHQWSTLRPLLLCMRHKRQVGISHLRQLCFVLEVFKALSQDRVPSLVEEMPFFFRLVGDVWRMRMAVCTIGMCTRAIRSLRLQGRMTRMRMRRTRRRMKIWTSWMIHSLDFPLGSGPCGCAGGSPPGTAGRGGGVCSLTL